MPDQIIKEIFENFPVIICGAFQNRCSLAVMVAVRRGSAASICSIRVFGDGRACWEVARSTPMAHWQVSRRMARWLLDSPMEVEGAFANLAWPWAGGEEAPEIELWWQDEARIPEDHKLTRRWARRGTRFRGRPATSAPNGPICLDPSRFRETPISRSVLIVDQWPVGT